MIGISRAMRVWAYTSPVDMRKGYEGLGAIVRNELKRDIMTGELYLFTNARRRRAKVLLFDGTGVAICMKRLEQGTFRRVRAADGGAGVEIDAGEFAMLLEGIDAQRVRRRKRYKPVKEEAFVQSPGDNG